MNDALAVSQGGDSGGNWQCLNALPDAHATAAAAAAAAVLLTLLLHVLMLVVSGDREGATITFLHFGVHRSYYSPDYSLLITIHQYR